MVSSKVSIGSQLKCYPGSIDCLSVKKIMKQHGIWSNNVIRQNSLTLVNYNKKQKGINQLYYMHIQILYESCLSLSSLSFYEYKGQGNFRIVSVNLCNFIK